MTSKTLKTELERSLAAGRVTDAFGSQAVTLARRYVNSRRWQGYNEQTREDIVSLYSVRFMRVWWSLRPDSNLFAYLTSMARSAALDYSRKEGRRRAVIVEAVIEE